MLDFLISKPYLCFSIINENGEKREFTYVDPGGKEVILRFPYIILQAGVF